ncbi:MAG TPA: MASE1 domain-containing protein [Vicinamibacterales bacterium]|nr:MASE1 domain-containing protein [Vicinamibacterales bacterium]
MRRDSLVRLGLLNILLFACYFLSGKGGLWFAQINPSATAIWPNTGIAIAAFLLFGNGSWPAILAGAFVVNLTTAGTAATSIGIALGNTVEGLTAAWLIEWYAGGSNVFNRASDAFRFAAIGALSTTLSATIGVATLWLGGLAAWQALGSVWLTWWLGDLAGALLVTPLVVLWFVSPLGRPRAKDAIEGTAVFSVLIALALLVFAGHWTPMPNAALEFLCLPPLVWMAFRFTPRETATALVVLSGIATWGTLRGAGPFAQTPMYGELVLQSFMITTAAATMAMSALVADSKRASSERAHLLEAATRARAEAEDANRAKDQFLAVLGHELRNPLAAISMAVHFTKESTRATPERTTAQDIIERQTAQLARLVDDLLEASRVATGKLALNREPLDLAAVSASCVEAMRSAGRTLDHHVEFSGEPAWLDGDATRLEQIASNLIGNALKYTPPGGRVRITVGRERASGAASSHVVLRVTDTGIGLDPDFIPRVFDLFVQGTAGSAHAPGGLGIGLTLVKRLVELHGGDIMVVSEGRNRGATFTARFPAIEPPAIATPAAGAPTHAARATVRRVLLVEDQEDVRQMLKAAIENLGHDVFEAANAEEAFNAVEHFTPHVAVVDIGLPVTDGYEVARRLRAIHGHSLRLIAVTGYSNEHARAQAQTAGFDLFLIKPVNISHLAEVLLQ